MSEDHGHDHAEIGPEDEHPGLQWDVSLSERAKRSLAMHELLIEKGVVTNEEVETASNNLRRRTPADGAKVVAKAWVDPEFKQRLLDDARAAVYELGYSLTHDAELSVVENTEDVHHVVVCTLCSCYPSSLLGPPPDWYKSFAYRQRTVIEPRSVMREFGLELSQDIQVRVVDSSADQRYFVLPERPAGTDGLTEEQLADLVTRDSMIGVTNPLSPEGAPIS